LVFSLVSVLASRLLAETVFLPVASNEPGRYSSHWRTSLDVFLPPRAGVPAEAEVPLELRFLEPGLPPVSWETTLRPGATLSIEDLAAAFAVVGTGAVQVEVDAAWTPLVFARIFDEDADGGTKGQGVPGVPERALLRAGEQAVVLELSGPFSERKNFRINLGWYQHEPGRVHFDYYDGNSVHRWIETHDYPAQNLDPIVETWTAETFDVAFVIVRVESGSGTGYFSIVDNRTNDASFRLFKRIGDKWEAGRVVLPVIAKEVGGDRGSYWNTKLEKYAPGEQTSGDDSFSVVNWFFRSTDAPTSYVTYSSRGIMLGGALPPVDGLGTLLYEFDPAFDLVTFARVFHTLPSGGTLGQTVSGVRLDELVWPGESAGVVGGGDGEAFRTNFGWFQYEAGTVRFTIREADGTIVRDEAVVLPVGHFQNRGLLGEPLDGHRSVVATVESGAGIGYASIVDNRSNDAVFRLVQKIEPVGETMTAKPPSATAARHPR